jgi:hypothetical protein
MYLVRLLWWRTNVSWKYSPLPCHVAHEEFSRTCAWRNIYCDTTSVMGGFFLSSATNVFNFSIRNILQCQWSTLGYCNLNTNEDEEVAFIGQRSGEPLKWRQFDEISKDTKSKRKYTAFFKTWWNLVEIFFSHLSLYYNNWMIFETRR